MTEFGMKILRIKNHEFENFNDVLKEIDQFILCTGPLSISGEG
jgi:very-short-patch-repair endonuclease